MSLRNCSPYDIHDVKMLLSDLVVCKTQNMEWNGLVEWTHGMAWLKIVINNYKKRNRSLIAQDT